MRVPVVYSASELVNWHVSEQYELGKWRPARCCGFGSVISHVMMRLRITWSIFTGRLDAVNWGSTSGEEPADKRNYADWKTPGWKNAARVD